MNTGNILWREATKDEECQRYQLNEIEYEVYTHGMVPIIIDFGLSSALVRVLPPQAKRDAKPELVRFAKERHRRNPEAERNMDVLAPSANLKGDLCKLLDTLNNESSLSREISIMWEDPWSPWSTGEGENFRLRHEHPAEFENFPGGCGGCQCYLQSDHFQEQVAPILVRRKILRTPLVKKGTESEEEQAKKKMKKEESSSGRFSTDFASGSGS